MNDRQTSLANAYIDGELTDDERAIAEHDPAVMAWVEQLRGLREQLRITEPPTATVRDDAITAAMAEFGPVASVVRSEVPQRSRSVYSRYLGVAAAVVLAGLLGLVVVNANSDGDSDGDLAGIGLSESAVAEDSGDLSSDNSTNGDRTSTESEQVDDVAQSSQAVSPAAATDSDDAGFDDDGGQSESSPSAAEGIADSIESDLFTVATIFAANPKAPITNERELTGYGIYILQLLAERELPPTPNTRCTYPDADSGVDILSETTYTFSDGPQPTLIAVDHLTMQAFAINPDTCAVLVVGAMP